MTEDKFKWDENNVTELLYHLSKKTNWVHSQMCKWAEDFKQSKLQSQDKPQPSSIDRIEVLKIGNRVDITTPEWPKAYYLQFCTSKEVHSDKFPAIKQAIEDVLNESDTINIDWASPPITEKFYSQSEVDTIRREAWDAAREMPDGTQLRRYVKWLTFNEWYKSLSTPTTQPKEEDKPVIIEDNDRCGICGGEMVYIRGRYPNTDKRKVCPTCTTERLEQISDLCSPEYGKAYQNKN